MDGTRAGPARDRRLPDQFRGTAVGHMDAPVVAAWTRAGGRRLPVSPSGSLEMALHDRGIGSIPTATAGSSGSVVVPGAFRGQGTSARFGCGAHRVVADDAVRAGGLGPSGNSWVVAEHVRDGDRRHLARQHPDSAHRGAAHPANGRIAADPGRAAPRGTHPPGVSASQFEPATHPGAGCWLRCLCLLGLRGDWDRPYPR